MKRSPREMTADEEVRRPFFGRPHVVILGAGASRAAFPHGDALGRSLPLMADLVDCVGLAATLRDNGIAYDGENFEEIFTSLTATHPSVARVVESAIREYFIAMRLPEEPTLYDHLVLSLREKDVIATFNWDPLLFAACARNARFTKPPYVVYLHGNVALGYCAKDRTMGSVRARCGKCRGEYLATQLMFPVRDKDYTSDPFLASQWRVMRGAMGAAYMLTIFGYSAPQADIAARTLLADGWRTNGPRELEEVELINLVVESELHDAWSDLIVSHHYRCERDFFDSWLAKHPRRSCEAMWNQTMECKFIAENGVPRVATMSELWDWHGSLIEAEAANITAPEK